MIALANKERFKKIKAIRVLEIESREKLQIFMKGPWRT